MKRFHGATACLQANGPTPPKLSVELEPVLSPNPIRLVCMRGNKHQEGVMQKTVRNGRVVFIVGGVVYFNHQQALDARDGAK